MAGNLRKIGIRRGLGGWGDVQMALAVAELYVRERGGPVTFGCPADMLPLCENVPEVEALATRKNGDDEGPPGDFDRLTFNRKWDITMPCIEYERALQPHVDRNRTELWAQKIGLEGTPRPRVYLSDVERIMAANWADRNGLDGRFVLGVIPRSHSWARDWTGWVNLIWRLKVRASLLVPVVFMAGVDSWDGIEYATCGIPVYRPEIRRHLALMDLCHLVAGVDTGPMHSAVGLGKPTLWVFSHIDGMVRTRGYKKTEVVQRTDLECCPCWYEARCHDPARFAVCRDVPVDRVEAIVLKHYKRWKCSTWFTRMARGPRRPNSATGTMFRETAG